MTRHGLFAIFALTGLALTIPESTLARPSFRPAFTGGPFRIVVPMGQPHFSGAPRIHGPAVTARPQITTPKPVIRTTTAGPESFRRHHRRFYGSSYPVTFGADAAYYGTPYDPSDAPVYVPPSADDTTAPATTPQAAPMVTADRGCRAQHVLVPNAGRTGESEITIIRC